MKAVFDTKPTSAYDDDISAHYHFPRRYMNIVERCIGDWIVLRRPRADGGNLAYFATARVSSVDPDPLNPAMSYARLVDFLPFDQVVPWTIDGRYNEEALRNLPQSQVGVYLRGRSVRAISDEDFLYIANVGYLRSFSLVAEDLLGAEQEPADRRVKRVVQALVNRVVRDANFRTSVYEAYDNRCAVTGLRMLDHMGNSEVHAAHIVGVAEGGPDVVQNGLALSGSVHWLFDHFLISLTDDHRLLVASAVPPEMKSLMVPEGTKIFLPLKPRTYPHPKYLQKHRARFDVLNERR